MKRRAAILLLFALIFAASPAKASDNTFWGTAVGASLGGLVGSTIGKGSGQLAATGAGVFLGGAIGNSIGRSMDNSYAYGYAPRVTSYDAYTPRFYGYTPTYVAPPSPPPPRVVYVEPQVVEYRRAAQPVYIEEGYLGPPAGDRLGRHCREFTQTIRIDGQLRESYGTACLSPDGTWRIVP